MPPCWRSCRCTSTEATQGDASQIGFSPCRGQMGRDDAPRSLLSRMLSMTTLEAIWTTGLMLAGIASCIQAHRVSHDRGREDQEFGWLIMSCVCLILALLICADSTL